MITNSSQRLGRLATPGFCTPLAMLFASVAFANEPAQSTWHPWKSWRPGDIWKLKVETHFPAQDKESAKPSVTRELKLLVLASEDLFIETGDKKERVSCWKLEYFPWKDGQETIGDGTFLSIDEKTGFPRNVARFDGTPASVKSLGKFSLVIGAPGDLPLEFFPPVKSAEARTSSESLSVQGAFTKDETVITATYGAKERAKILVVEKWRTGEKWWREYEKYVDGRKVLSATRVLPDSYSPPRIKIKKDAWKADHRYLRYDARLQPRVTVVENNPSIPELFRRMHESTGLEFEVDESLRQHSPKLGSLQLPEIRTFTVMEAIARNQLIDGHWEQTERGYRLMGKSTAPIVAAAPVSASESQSLQTASEPKQRWWLWIVSVAAICAIGIGLFIGKEKKN